MDEVLQNSKFTYLSNRQSVHFLFITFCRIQNLHISQTIVQSSHSIFCFVEFKIYISLKQSSFFHLSRRSFVEFKIYISLKRQSKRLESTWSFVEFKIYISLKLNQYLTLQLSCFVEFKIYISLKHRCMRLKREISFVEFKIYISLKPQIEIWRKNFEFGYKKMDRHRSRPEGNLDKIFI